MPCTTMGAQKQMGVILFKLNDGTKYLVTHDGVLGSSVFSFVLANDHGAICQGKSTHELNTFWPPIPRLLDSQIDERNTNNDKVKKKIISSGNPTHLNAIFAQLEYIQGSLGEIIARGLFKIKKIFF